MISELISIIATASALVVGTSSATTSPLDTFLASREISLNNRQKDPWVSEVFKDNILLNVAYMFDKVESLPIAWGEIKKPFKYEVKLKPKEVFAYHEDVLPEYQGRVSKTTNAHFNSAEGFRSDGYLFGDGICHLASLINWAAKDAKLEVKAPTNHDFAAIADIPREYGVSIYSEPKGASNALQNLYIANNREKTIKFVFSFDGEKLKVAVFELN